MYKYLRVEGTIKRHSLQSTRDKLITKMREILDHELVSDVEIEETENFLKYHLKN